METLSWRKRWVDNQIGWHQEKFNPRLLTYWQGVAGDDKGAVLVPLCGKTLDMIWLAEQGHPVVGVELSEIAIEAFFKENEMDAQWHEEHGVRLMRCGVFTIYCCDFFETDTKWLGPIDFIYDRAAHIALPPQVRRRYAEHMGQLMSAQTRGLLLTVEYDQERHDGPPFSVSQIEIEQNFGIDFELDILCENEIIENQPKYREWGLDSLIERAHCLKAKAG
jgi:thiopurine S-methyltransferase